MCVDVVAQSDTNVRKQKNLSKIDKRLYEWLIVHASYWILSYNLRTVIFFSIMINDDQRFFEKKTNKPRRIHRTPQVRQCTVKININGWSSVRHQPTTFSDSASDCFVSSAPLHPWRPVIVKAVTGFRDRRRCIIVCFPRQNGPKNTYVNAYSISFSGVPSKVYFYRYFFFYSVNNPAIGAANHENLQCVCCTIDHGRELNKENKRLLLLSYRRVRFSNIKTWLRNYDSRSRLTVIRERKRPL